MIKKGRQERKSGWYEVVCGLRLISRQRLAVLTCEGVAGGVKSRLYKDLGRKGIDSATILYLRID
jgi:hypothetical protein